MNRPSAEPPSRCSLSLPQGFSLTGVACGLKRDATNLDLGLVLSDVPATAAGVYTTNQVQAAPVILDRSRTPSERIRAVVFNSGNANACTGEQGMHDAREMAAIAARRCGIDSDQVLVMSTGIIGHRLDMHKVRQGIVSAVEQLRADEEGARRLSQALMTTDTFPKVAVRQCSIAGRTVKLIGFAKGAGMIAPRMATMLGLVLTDMRLSLAQAQHILSNAAENSFNAISVDGHTSTNDTLLLLANGLALSDAAGVVGTHDVSLFANRLEDLCGELSRAIVRDGEGAQHMIEIRVRGADSNSEAQAIARCIANSPLVKTAIAGGDPNWGRIISAAGFSGVRFDPGRATLRLNRYLLFQFGEPAQFDPVEVSASLRQSAEVLVELDCGLGPGVAHFWTCDLTAEYVRINADYHT